MDISDSQDDNAFFPIYIYIYLDVMYLKVGTYKIRRVLKIVVGPNTSPLKWHVRWGLSPPINTCLDHILCNVRLFNISFTSNTIEHGLWI